MIDDVHGGQFLWAGITGIAAAALFDAFNRQDDAAVVSLVGLLTGMTFFVLWLIVHYWRASKSRTARRAAELERILNDYVSSRRALEETAGIDPAVRVAARGLRDSTAQWLAQSFDPAIVQAFLQAGPAVGGSDAAMSREHVALYQELNGEAAFLTALASKRAGG